MQFSTSCVTTGRNASLTDFGRAVKELNVETIYSKSAREKGTMERANRTLQDRLIKTFRQKGIIKYN